MQHFLNRVIYGFISPLVRLSFFLLLVFILSRLALHLLPGDPVDVMMAEFGSALDRQKLIHDLKLDQGIVASIISDFKDHLHGNLGRSLHSGDPIGVLLWPRIQKTLLLGSIGFLLTLILSIFLAFIIVNFESRFLRQIEILLLTLSNATPTVWLATMMAYLLGVHWPIFEISRSLGLPITILVITHIGPWTKLVAERIRSDSKQVFINAARARGIHGARLFFKYQFMPIIGPLCVYFGLQGGQFLAGSTVIETLFDWPGLGSFFIESLQKRDYPIIQASIFFTAAVILVFNLLGDILSRQLDPRQRV